jgi:hypothetical protein
MAELTKYSIAAMSHPAFPKLLGLVTVMLATAVGAERYCLELQEHVCYGGLEAHRSQPRCAADC